MKGSQNQLAWAEDELQVNGVNGGEIWGGESGMEPDFRMLDHRQFNHQKL